MQMPFNGLSTNSKDGSSSSLFCVVSRLNLWMIWDNTTFSSIMANFCPKITGKKIFSVCFQSQEILKVDSFYLMYIIAKLLSNPI